MNNFELESLVRPNILELKPYSSARDEFSTNSGIFLDANENPFGKYNRYPDPYQKKLKEKISEIKDISMENIFLGNGSDEIIDLIIRIFAEPKKDEILSFFPTYGMYEVSANINNAKYSTLNLDENFQIKIDKELQSKLKEKNLKIIFICSPNNPTGNLIEEEKIIFILENFPGIIVLDEAYADFADKTFLGNLKKYPNLIILQTFSKAWGLAGTRVGMAFTNEKIIKLLNKVKPPYNVSSLNQNEVLNKLNDLDAYENNLQILKNEKIKLLQELSNYSFIEKIYPTDANFILIKTADANRIYNYLVKEKIIIRNRDKVLKNCLRISIGTEEENKKLISTLNNYQK